MPQPEYYQLDNFVYYGDSLENIKQFEWFNTFPFQDKKQFVFILKTYLSEENVRYMLMDIFPKIFSLNVEVLGVSGSGDINIYLLTFTLHYDNFWDDVVDKLFLYCMAFLNTMSYHILSRGQPYFNSFENNFMLAVEHGDYIINPEKFFNSSMARLLISFQSQDKAQFVPLWGCMNNDIMAIKTILTTPRNMRKVLLKVPRMNCTLISEGISDEYTQLRRTL